MLPPSAINYSNSNKKKICLNTKTIQLAYIVIHNKRKTDRVNIVCLRERNRQTDRHRDRERNTLRQTGTFKSLLINDSVNDGQTKHLSSLVSFNLAVIYVSLEMFNFDTKSLGHLQYMYSGLVGYKAIKITQTFVPNCDAKRRKNVYF
jgi:hypothetical protein